MLIPVMNYYELLSLRKNHPSWSLLRADHAPLIISFLNRIFIDSNLRSISQSEIESMLEDELYEIRDTFGEDKFPKKAGVYLNEWAQAEKGWLRKFYPEGDDEPHYDLTPATEKVIRWIIDLGSRTFIGTESRLLTVFELLKQIVSGTESDTEFQIAELEKKKLEIEQKINKIKAGNIELLEESSLIDRFQQFSLLSQGLLGDFREVEHNFRELDRTARESIATWEGSKGELLEKLFGDRDEISDSDQGRSFKAFMEFIMSASRQNEFTELIEKIFSLEAIKKFNPDPKLKKIHFDWLEAGEVTQRTVAKLSQQLRSFLDSQSYLENKRIIKILKNIEVSAIGMRQYQPKQKDFFEVDLPKVEMTLPLEKPMFKVPIKPQVNSELVLGDVRDIDTSVLFNQKFVDMQKIKLQIRRLLQDKAQVTLKEVIESYPLTQGLSELVAYMVYAGKNAGNLYDESFQETIFWVDDQEKTRSATIPRIIFSR